MWVMDLPELDETTYPEPTEQQRYEAATDADEHLENLKRALERLTIPQQRAIIGKIAGSVYRADMKPLGEEKLEEAS